MIGKNKIENRWMKELLAFNCQLPGIDVWIWSLHGHSSCFEHCSTKNFLMIGREIWMIFFLTIIGLAVTQTSDGIVWLVPGREITTGDGLITTGGPQLNVKLSALRLMTRGACLLMKTFGFGVVLHGAGVVVVGQGAAVVVGQGTDAVNTIGAGNPQPKFWGSAVANDCNLEI